MPCRIFLFGWGLVDDAAVLSFVAAQIAGEQTGCFRRGQKSAGER